MLHNGPWNFENYLVMARPLSALHSKGVSCLDKELFWVLLTGLPRYCYTMEVEIKVYNALQECTTIQLREDKVLGTKYFRFRVLVDITKALKRIFKVTTPYGCTHAGLMKYEWLPPLCFFCGHIGHRYRSCSFALDEDMEVKNIGYGPWMRGVDFIASNQIFFTTLSLLLWKRGCNEGSS